MADPAPADPPLRCDVLWRRTRLALHYTPAQRQQVADWFAAQADRPGLAAVHTSWHSRLGRR